MEPNPNSNPNLGGEDKRRSLLFIDFDPLLPARKQQHHVDRFTINRHVQLDRFRKQRAAAIQIESESATPSTRSSQQDLSIWTSLDNVSIDPFATSAIPLDTKMNKLLNHWLERIRQCPLLIHDQTAKLRQQIMPLILAEPSVLFAMLGYAAADMAGNGAESGKRKCSAIQRTPEVIGFKIKAIHFLSLKLKDPEEAIKPSLAVLWAVTYVCVIELLSDNNDELRIHLSGVRRIIELRGGFQAFSPIIIYWILGAWRVLPRSSTAAPPPLMRREIAQLRVISSPLNPDQRRVGLALIESDHVEQFDNRLVQVIRDLREITLWYEFIAISDHEFPITDTNYYNDLQFQTQNFLFSFSSGQQEGSCDYLQEACRIGLLIYAYAPSLSRSSVAIMIRKLEMDLLDVMNRCFLRVEAQPDIAGGELLMWALFLTAFAFEDQPEWPGIKALLAQTRRRLGLIDWEDVRRRLLGFLYTDRIYQELYRMIWIEAMKV